MANEPNYSSNPSKDEPKKEKVRVIPLEYIDEFPGHPFKVLDDESMQKLMNSIEEIGVQSPIVARIKEDQRYEIISGHRRVHACRRLGLKLIPAIVRDLSRDEAMRRGFCGKAPTLKDFYEELKAQPEPEAKDIALSLELFTSGSLDTFANETNVDTKNRLICYDIHDLGKALMPIGMLVVLDNILNRITANKARGRKTYIFIDEIYLLFKHEYSANFLFTLWKRVRKYGAFITGITQNVEDLLQSHTARTMLANSELVVMLNQAATDREELARLMGISDLQMSYITNVDEGHGLVKIGGALVPFVNKVPKDTKLYALMTTKFGES